MSEDIKEMKGDIKAVRKNTDLIPQMSQDIKEMNGDIKAVRKNTDLIPQISQDIKEMNGDIKAVRKSTDTTLEEIKGLRENIQPSHGMSMGQIQADVRAIKERLGML